ncbi:uncharacterized protein RJT21DRAFT_9727 [Scheffersomyces amazonensis]|uniref:uncharacterized protein n=1 Tax=Scheffersomyces amazonensis TaxID=1078765 RepID=UPI00315D784E
MSHDLEDQVRLFHPQQEEHIEEMHIIHRKFSRVGDDTKFMVVNEQSALLGSFPYTLVMKVSASEPRDVLQSERTCLTFIRFSTSLFFTALGIIVNFKFDSSGEKTTPTSPPHSHFNASLYSTVVSYILLILALATLVLSAVNYFITVTRYANHKIDTYSFNNFATVICMTCVIITLMGASISLIVQGYIEQS